MEPGGLLHADLFLNNGSLDVETSRKITFAKAKSFDSIASECFRTLSDGVLPKDKVRLFDDYGNAVTSFYDVPDGSSIVLVVSESEEFIPIDRKAKWMKEAARVGWLRENELDDFVKGLSSAIQLDTCAADEPYVASPNVGPEYLADLMAAVPPSPSASAGCSPSNGHLSATPIMSTSSSATHMTSMSVLSSRSPATLSDPEAVLASIPKLRLTEDATTCVATRLATVMESLRPPEIDEARVQQLESGITIPRVDIDAEPSSPEPDIKLEVYMDMPERYSEDGRDLMTPAEKQRLADMRSRRTLNKSIDRLEERLPKVVGPRISRRSLFEHAIKYLKQAVNTNRSLASENETLHEDLEAARRSLAANHRLLRQRRVGVIMMQLWAQAPGDDMLQPGDSIVPQDPKKPFFGHLIYWNHIMELMTGISAKDALGKPMVEVFGFYKNDYVKRSHFLFIKNTPKYRGSATSNSGSYEHVYIIERSDGRLISARGYMSLLLDPQTKRVANAMSIYTDFQPFQPFHI